MVSAVYLDRIHDVIDRKFAPVCFAVFVVSDMCDFHSQKGFGMKRMFVFALALFYFVTLRPTGDNDDIGWSSPVNGLQTRLSFSRQQSFNGTPLIATYLELRNVADVANVMEIPFKPELIQFEVVDEQDKVVAPTNTGPYDELTVEVGTLRLPHDSYLRFNVSHHGAGISKNQGALLDLGVLSCWVFSSGDKHSYYLRGRFSSAPGKEKTWTGMIEMPKVKVPTVE